MIAVTLKNGISPIAGYCYRTNWRLIAGLLTGILHVKIKNIKSAFRNFSHGDFILCKLEDYGKSEYSYFY